MWVGPAVYMVTVSSRIENEEQIGPILRLEIRSIHR